MGEPQQPQAIQPQPVPSSWGYGVAAKPDGGTLVVIQIGHFLGQFVGFLTPDEADGVADQIHATAAEARRQEKAVFVPPSVLLGPNGQPMSFVPGASSPLSNGHKPRADVEVPTRPDVSEPIVGPGEHAEGCLREESHPGACVLGADAEEEPPTSGE